jgi:hypothetical protein
MVHEECHGVTEERLLHLFLFGRFPDAITEHERTD